MHSVHYIVLFLSLLLSGVAALNTTLVKAVCVRIGKETSSRTAVYYPDNPVYATDLSHYYSSSSQNSTCVVEAGNTNDVGKILRILGQTRTPFAVKGGGHSANPSFSSTPGVHISMVRFSEVTYNSKAQTAVLGAGLVWDDVYAALEPYNVSVVGGRVSGIGIAGFTLGGGYSWKTNEYGLTSDTVVSYELVTPDGNVCTVTNKTSPDLFFALKGGFNNFGIVTRFTLKTFPQSAVWGGFTFILQDFDAVNAAIIKFATTVTDPKAALLSSYVFTRGMLLGAVQPFYDGPTPPPGIFDDFLTIPSIASDLRPRSLLSLVQSVETVILPGVRGVFNSISVTKVTPTLLAALVNETNFWNTQLSNKSIISVGYAIEPFLPTIFQHNTSPSAYPPERAFAVFPFNINFAWTDPQFDAEIQEAVRTSSAHIHQVARSEGQPHIDDAPMYPNYAIFDTPLVDMYGNNLGKLQAIRKQVDPDNVMKLAGGFKF